MIPKNTLDVKNASYEGCHVHFTGFSKCDLCVDANISISNNLSSNIIEKEGKLTNTIKDHPDYFHPCGLNDPSYRYIAPELASTQNEYNRVVKNNIYTKIDRRKTTPINFFANDEHITEDKEKNKIAETNQHVRQDEDSEKDATYLGTPTNVRQNGDKVESKEKSSISSNKVNYNRIQTEAKKQYVNSSDEVSVAEHAIQQDGNVIVRTFAMDVYAFGMIYADCLLGLKQTKNDVVSSLKRAINHKNPQRAIWEHNLILQCINENPMERPSIDKIVAVLESSLK